MKNRTVLIIGSEADLLCSVINEMAYQMKQSSKQLSTAAKELNYSITNTHGLVSQLRTNSYSHLDQVSSRNKRRGTKPKNDHRFKNKVMFHY